MASANRVEGRTEVRKQGWTISRAIRTLVMAAVMLTGWSQSEAANILFVVGNTTLNAGDASVKSLLEGMGHSLTIKTGPLSATSDTALKSLVVISSTVTAAEVNTKFKNVRIPVLTWEASLFNPMGMTNGVSGTDFGTTAAQTDMNVRLGAHRLTYNGTILGLSTIYNSADIVSWGVPGPAAIKVATLAGDASKWTEFAYESGSAMIGMNAPARRVGIFMADLGPSKLSGVGSNLLVSAIWWLLGYTEPVLTLQPSDATVAAGQTATFTMAATGNPTPGCIWYSRGTVVGNTCSYTTPPVTAADNGTTFFGTASNVLGGANTRMATLNILTPPVITGHPANVSAAIGTSATFSVAATGSPTLLYQWRKGGVNITGATSASYTIPAVTAADNGASFACFVVNPADVALSNAAILSTGTPPVITANLQNRTLTVGQTTLFAVAVTGSGTFEYEYTKNGVSLYRGPLATYTFGPVTAADNNSRWIITVRSPFGTAVSAEAVLTVVSPPVIVNHPTAVGIFVGGTGTFNVTATGGGTLTYQWRKNGAVISGATATAYTTPPATLADNGSTFDVIVGNAAGSVTSNYATLMVAGPPVITVQPAPQSVVLGQTAGFSVTATGAGPITYQWRKNGAAISGATAAAYTTPPTTAADNGASFNVVVTNPAGSVTSTAAVLTLNVPAAYPFADGFETGTFGSAWTFYKSNTTYGRTLVTSSSVPYAGSYHAQMDVGTSSTYNLNEMILTVDLAGQSNVELSFFHKNTGEEDELLPATFVNHYNGDGVSISANGTNWYKAVGTTVSEGGSSVYRIFRVNLDAVAAVAGIAYNSSFKIKFQQYDDNSTPTDGYFFDNIRLGAPLPNLPPTVSITSPANGSTYTSPATVYLYSNPTDPDGTISKVEYYRGGTTLVGTSTFSPFTYTWSGVTAGAYSLTAIAYDNLNLPSPASAPVSITVNETPPYVYATATPTTGGAPLNVSFTATNSGGTVTAWNWNFGDGTNAATQNATHTYANPGAFNATVTATGPGGSSSYPITITVVAPPAVTITATPISGTRPLTVSFSVANTGGAINNYAWNFGNGGTSSSANPVYTYTAAGAFNATLTASNVGGSSAASQTITVNPIVYTLTTCVTGNGSTVPPAGTTPVNEGQSTPISATPAPGNQFETWRVASGNAVIANPALASTSVTLSSNATVCADFHPDPVALTMVHTGDGSTTPSATASVIPGRNFDISAAPAAGFKFLGWSVPAGDAVVANPGLASTRLTLTGASTVQAEFIPESTVPANKKLAISGELADATGNRVGYPNPEIVDVSVRLWTALTGGTAVHSESFLAVNGQGISVDDGFFVARLGEGTTTGDLQQAIVGNPQLWVEITIEGPAPDVLAPRTPLTASAYALGGVPTLVPMGGGVLHGNGDPNVSKAGAAIGSYYVNDADNTTWLKISSGWSLLR